jgi:hypothetical protein
MREEFETHEVWPFECHGCRHVWESEYTARHLSDRRGHNVAVWLRKGVPVQPPWVESRCPSCDGVNVATFPVGYLARDPQVLAPLPAAAQELTPPVCEVVAEVVSDVVCEVKAAVRHGRRPSRTLVFTVLAIALVIFACYEIYELTIASQVH